MDLYNELESKIQELEISIRSLRKTGQKYAEAERDYKILVQCKNDAKIFVEENYVNNFSSYKQFKNLIKEIEFID